MTFKEWKATRQRVRRSDKKYTWMFEDWDLQSDELFVYGLDDRDRGNMLGYIEINHAYTAIHGKQKLFEFEMYTLVLECNDWFVSVSGLDEIEHKLYDFYKDTGAFDTPEESLEKSLEGHVHNINLRIGEYVKQRWPKAKTGDIDPGAQGSLDYVLRNYLRYWIKNNTDWRNK